MIDPRWQAVRQLLVIRLDNLGDVLVTTPAIHALRQGLPGASITLLASPAGAQAGRLNPDLDEVLVADVPWMDPWNRLPLDPARELALIQRVAARKFDAAVIFTSFRQSALPAAYLCYLAGIPLRAAASIDGPGSLLTTRHKHPEHLMHEVERGLDLVAVLGFATGDEKLVLTTPDAARAAIATDGIWQEGRPRIVIHPGCSMPARTYPWRGFADIAARVVTELGAVVALTGTSDERELVEQITNAIPAAAREQVRPLAGERSFPELCALIESADVTITNNTGPMHVAAALGCPVVALFAYTNPPRQWGPWMVHHRMLVHDVPCQLCYARVCPVNHACLTHITPERVVAEARALMREAASGAPAPKHPIPTDVSRPMLGCPGVRPFMASVDPRPVSAGRGS